MELTKRARELEEEVIQMRHYLHENPEISMQEKATMDYVERTLSALGITCERVKNGGIIGVLEGGKPGKTLILRSDLDALPIEEAEENLKQKRHVMSRQSDAAHLCGHDAHMAMLLGAAKILAEHRAEWTGKVIFAFEQGEETGGGIFHLLQRLVEIGADGVWGIHMKSDLASGKISVDPGPRMAGIYPFHVEIKGVGGHGSRPDLSHSPVDCFHAFYQRFQALRLHELNPLQPITFSIGSVHAGALEAANVIPETLVFRGTARFLHFEQGQALERQLIQALEEECAAHHCTYRFLRKTMPMDLNVYNQEECAAIAAEAVRKSLGAEVLAHYPAWMASEPFAFYQKYFPGVFAFVGIENEAKGTGAEHHNPYFDVDDDVLYGGVVATVQYTLDFLASEEPIDFEPEARTVKELFKEVGF